MTEETDVKELGSETQPVNETVGSVNNEPSTPADFVIPDEYKELFDARLEDYGYELEEDFTR